MGSSVMKFLRLAFSAAALLLSSEAVVHPQTTLRIAIAQDPDVLARSISRTYVGRIVFAAVGDKLFDIEQLVANCREHDAADIGAADRPGEDIRVLGNGYPQRGLGMDDRL